MATPRPGHERSPYPGTGNPVARMPGMLEQLLVLPAPARIVAGGLLVGMGVAAGLLMPGGLLSWVLIGVGGMVGAPLLYLGIAELRERRREREQRARAESELAELAAELTVVQADKRGVERFLLERGYTSAAVRRWIAQELDAPMPLSHRR